MEVLNNCDKANHVKEKMYGETEQEVNEYGQMDDDYQSCLRYFCRNHADNHV